jgi:hypothetical protein
MVSGNLPIYTWRHLIVLLDLGLKEPEWLASAAQSMARATKRDWESFQSSQLATVGAHHSHAA